MNAQVQFNREKDDDLLNKCYQCIDFFKEYGPGLRLFSLMLTVYPIQCNKKKLKTQILTWCV